MSEYSSTAPSSRGPRSPIFGTATYTELSTTQPHSRRTSSTLSYTEAAIHSSSSSDNGSSAQLLRRINISPVPSSRETDSDSYSYSDGNSLYDRAEVEAALTAVEDELEDTLEMWNQGPAALRRDRRILSIISEHTEELPSRHTSYALSGSRPTTQYSSGEPGETGRRSAGLGGVTAISGHTRMSTEPLGPRAFTPGGGVRNIVAQIEARGSGSESATSTPSHGHSRTASAPAGPRSPSPYTSTYAPTSTSQTMPTLSSFSPFVSTASSYTTSGYGTVSGYGSSTNHDSRSSSPAKSRSGSTISGPRAPSTSTSRRTPSTHTRTTSVFTGTSPLSPTNTFTGFTGTSAVSVTDSETATGTRTDIVDMPRGSPVRQPQSPPREPLAQVKNIVAAWKKMQPERAKIASASVSPSPRQSRRRSVTPRSIASSSGSNVSRRSNIQSPERSAPRAAATASTGDTQSVTGILPSEMTDLGIVGEPIDIGQLWYLNVHAAEPYRWQRCQAMLYRHMLLLTWITPAGAKGIVTLDLLNCTEVQSVPSPTHVLAKNDIGTIAAIRQSENARRGGPGVLPGDLGLLEMLTPFHLMYSDGIERLAAESPRERLQWTSAIMDVLAVPIPSDRSETGSVRTMRTHASTDTSRSTSSVGSASTNYVAPLSPSELADLVSLSGSSSLSRRPSVATFTSRAMDDSAISGSTYLPHADPRVIPPSRMSSLRRTSSMTDLDESLTNALRMARNSRGGLGFGLSLAQVPIGDGSPVTISSGPRLGRDVSLTPPPRTRNSSRTRISEPSSTTSSDHAFFTASSGSESQTSATSWRSSSRSTSGATGKEALATTVVTGTADPTLVTSTETDIVVSTISRRNPSSASLLGDSHTGTTSSSASPSRSALSRSGGIRRRTGTSLTSRTFTASYSSRTESSSDKENSETNGSSRSRPATEYSSYPYTFSTMDSLTQTETYSSDEWTRSTSRSPTPTPSSVSSRRPVSERTAESETSADKPPTSSSGTSEYVTAKSPTASLSSLPSIPSESDFVTAEVCSVPSIQSEYITADVCPTETDFQTADICSIPSTDFVTCEVCGSEVATEYGTAKCHCKSSPVPSMRSIPSIVSSEAESVLEPVLEQEVHPENIPLPSSMVSDITPSSLLSLPSPPHLPEAVRSPSTPEPPTLSTPSSPSIPGPSPLAPPVAFPALASISTVSSPTESSITPTSTVLPSETVPSIAILSTVPSATTSSTALSSPLPSTVPSTLPRSPTVSVPSIPESLWAAETDRSYDSSFLRASPSAQSIAIPEPLDTSFETSFLRPTTTGSREVSLITPITEISSSTVDVTLSTSLPQTVSSIVSLSPSSTVSLSPSPAVVLSPSPTFSPSPSPAVSLSPSPAVSLSISPAVSLSPSPVVSLSPSPMASLSPSSAVELPPSPAVSLSLSPAVSLSPSAAVSLSLSPAISLSSGPMVSLSPSPPVSLSLSPDISRPLSPAISLSSSPAVSLSPSPVVLPALSPTPSPQFPLPVSLSPSLPCTPQPRQVEADLTVRSEVPSSITSVSSLPASPALKTAPVQPEPSLKEPSTEPSLVSVSESSSHRSPSPLPIPPQRSPSPPATPSVSASVSVSTPRGSVPSVHSVIETIPSEPPYELPRPQTPTLDKLLRFLQDADQLRGDENRELREAVQEIRGLLGDVLDEIRRRAEIPPPPPQKDRSVGRSSPSIMTPSPKTVLLPPETLSAPPQLQEPRSLLPPPVIQQPQPRQAPMPIELSPPRLRVPSPESSLETMSYLSSHHSDDFSLLEEESYPVPPSSPSWPSDSSSSPASTRVRSAPSRTPTPSLVSDSSTPSRPQSPSSSITARPAPPSFNLGDIRDILDGLRRQMGSLTDGQENANRMLDEARQRPPIIQRDVPDVSDRLARIESLLHNLIDRPVQAPPTAPPPAPMPSEEESETTSSDTSSLFRVIQGFIGRQGASSIRMPAPVRATGPSLDEQLADMLSTEPPAQPPPVEPPPPLVPLIYRPIHRAARPRSASPTFEVDLPPRSRSVPILEDIPPPRRRRPISRRGPPFAPAEATVPPEAEAPAPLPRPHFLPPGPGTVPPPPPPILQQDARSYPPGTVHGTGSVPRDFDQEVRSRRDPKYPGGWYIHKGTLERAPSAPPDLGTPRRGKPWYQPAPEEASIPPPVPPVGIVQPEIGAQPAVMQFPASLEDIITLLRESRLAASATLDQQQEMSRYMQQLNEWLGRDVHDRQEEIRAVAARVDQLRDLLLQLLAGQPHIPGAGHQPPVIPPPPSVHPPHGVTPGVPHEMFMSMPEPAVPPPPVVPTTMGGPFPPLATPSRGPVFPPVIPPPPVIPDYERSPVIPPHPTDFTPTIPVVPHEDIGDVRTGYRPYQPEDVRRPESPALVPPRPPSQESPDDTGSYISTDEDILRILPPHLGGPQPERLPPEMVRLPTSRPSTESSGDIFIQSGTNHPAPPMVQQPGPPFPEPQTVFQRSYEGPTEQGIVIPPLTGPPPIVVQPPSAHGVTPGRVQGIPEVVHTGQSSQPLPIHIHVQSPSPPQPPSRIEFAPSRTYSHSPSPPESHERIHIVPSVERPERQEPIVIQPPPVGHPSEFHRVPTQPPVVIVPPPPEGGREPPIVIRTASHRSGSPSEHYRDGRPYRSPPRSHRSGSPSERYRDGRPYRSPPRSHRSGSPPIVVRTHTRDTRSRSPTPPYDDRHGSRMSPPMIVRTGTRRTRSGSPRPVYVEGERSHRSRSPVLIVRRSRSRTPPAVIVEGSHRPSSPPLVGRASTTRGRSPRRSPVHGDRRSHRPHSPTYEARPLHRSRSPAYEDRPSHRSRSPTYEVRRSHRPHSPTYEDRPSHRSRSPTYEVRRSHHSRSPVYGDRPSHRSRSPTYEVRPSHRSHSPAHEARPSHRAHSPVILRTGAEHSPPRTPIIVEGHPPRSSSPTMIVRTGTRQGTSRMRSPTYEDRRSSRSHSPIIVRTTRRSGSGERPPVIIQGPSRGTRTRSPTPVYIPERDPYGHEARTPSVRVRTGTRRSQSPTYVEGDRHPRPSRASSTLYGHTDRPYSPPRSERLPHVIRASHSPDRRRTPHVPGDPGTLRVTRSRTPPSVRHAQTGHPTHIVPGETHPPSRSPSYFVRHPSEPPSDPMRVVVQSPTPYGPRSPHELASSGRRLTPPPSEYVEAEGVPRVRMGRSPSPSPTIIRVPTQEPIYRRPTPTTVRTHIPTPVERVRVPGRTPSEVSEHHFVPESPPRTVMHTRTPSHISELERAFSDDGQRPIPVPVHRPRSPIPSIEQQIRRIPEGQPIIPIVPTPGVHTVPSTTIESEVPQHPGVPVTRVAQPHPVAPGEAAPAVPLETAILRTEATIPPPTHIPGDVPGYVSSAAPSVALPVPPPVAERIPPVEPLPVPRSPAPAPRPHTPIDRRAYSGPLDLAYADAERERVERFGELERQIAEQIQLGHEAEERRDDDFRAHEEERERIFLEREAQREQEAQQRGESILRAIENRVEERLAELPTTAPLPVPPPHEMPPSHAAPLRHEVPPEVIREEEEPVTLPPHAPPPASPSESIVEPPHAIHREDLESDEAESIARTIQSSVMDAATRHAQEILETVRLEREELAQEREAARAENERIFNELAAERARIDAEHTTQIEELRQQLTAAREELAAAQASLEQERQLRITEDTERREADRLEDRQRAEDLATQLADVTNVVSETRDELSRKRAVSDERWEQKEAKAAECDQKMNEMRDMLAGMRDVIQDMQQQQEAQRQADAGKPSVESVLDELRRENGSLRELLQQLADGWRADNNRQYEELLNTVRDTAHQQVPFNVGRYLDDFSKSLAREVRQLLTEVNSLVEEKTRLQFEIATLMEFKARYDPGGFFWRPGAPMPPATAPAPEVAPPEPQPAAPMLQEPVPGAWRTTRPRRGRRARESAAAPPPAVPGPSAPPAPPQAVPQMYQMPVVPAGDPRSISWATWAPDPNYQPSEASLPPEQRLPPEMLAPPQSSPGLFGPRTPPDRRM